MAREPIPEVNGVDEFHGILTVIKRTRCVRICIDTDAVILPPESSVGQGRRLDCPQLGQLSMTGYGRLRTPVAICIINLDINSVEPPAVAANSFELEGSAPSLPVLVITQPLQLEILNQPEKR